MPIMLAMDMMNGHRKIVEVETNIIHATSVTERAQAMLHHVAKSLGRDARCFEVRPVSRAEYTNFRGTCGFLAPPFE